MNGALLVINAGSATVKYAVYDESFACLARGTEEGVSHDAMIGAVLSRTGEFPLVAAGHRVVHGGDRFWAPTLIDDDVLAVLRALMPLAPLHQPHNLAGIHAVREHRPELPQVACFDTAFHQTQPPIARRFALPRALHDAGIKRYGFHGLSYEYIASKVPRDRRVIAAHLGNGSSLCAMRDGRSVASTMGFTALDGLMMGTRSGAIDPGVLLYLLQEKRLSPKELERLLYRDSGLLGVSGISHDMRALLASSDPRAKEAVDLYVYRAVREIGSLAAALGGLDLLVFTGGIGEHAASVRDAIVEATAWLSPFEVAVVPTNEEEMIARHTAALHQACGSPRPSPVPV
jgi:acetate kinase